MLDLEFRKIDKEAEGKLKDMQQRTGKEFVKMDEDIVNWFDVTSKDATFDGKYSKVCADLSDPKSVLGQSVASLGTVSTDGKTSKFAGNRANCDALTGKKLAAYKSAARIFAQQNVVDSYKSDKHEFGGKLKKEYQNFLMKWTTYIGELSRIKDKWNEKTPNPN